jgi:hypothetical protein
MEGVELHVFRNLALGTINSANTLWIRGYAEPRTGWILCQMCSFSCSVINIKLTFLCKYDHTKGSFLRTKLLLKIVHCRVHFTNLKRWFVIVFR